MASIEDVVAGLRGVLAQLDVARRRLADAAWPSAADGYTAVLSGATHQTAADVVSLAVRASELSREADELIARCESAVTAIINRLTGTPAQISVGLPTPGIGEVPLARGLPGAKAEGRWRNGRGEDVVLRSGRGDQWWAEAERFARDRGLLAAESRASLDLSKHIEIKLAMRMRDPRERCRRHELVRIDREVCGTQVHQAGWLLTCDKMLPTYLSPGATLTVVEPDGTRRTYIGDEDAE
jgi:hypothetical protein